MTMASLEAVEIQSIEDEAAHPAWETIRLDCMRGYLKVDVLSESAVQQHISGLNGPFDCDHLQRLTILQVGLDPWRWWEDHTTDWSTEQRGRMLRWMWGHVDGAEIG